VPKILADVGSGLQSAIRDPDHAISKNMIWLRLGTAR
jgi:hypothetical protein